MAIMMMKSQLMKQGLMKKLMKNYSNNFKAKHLVREVSRVFQVVVIAFSSMSLWMTTKSQEMMMTMMTRAVISKMKREMFKTTMRMRKSLRMANLILI